MDEANFSFPDFATLLRDIPIDPLGAWVDFQRCVVKLLSYGANPTEQQWGLLLESVRAMHTLDHALGRINVLAPIFYTHLCGCVAEGFGFAHSHELVLQSLNIAKPHPTKDEGGPMPKTKPEPLDLLNRALGVSDSHCADWSCVDCGGSLMDAGPLPRPSWMGPPDKNTQTKIGHCTNHDCWRAQAHALLKERTE